MTNKELIEKVWNENKKLWHSRYKISGIELHHSYGRVGLMKCCLRFFVAGQGNHHRDYGWIKGLRMLFREDRRKAERNYMRGIGCKEWIFPECERCAMVKYGREW